MSLKKWSLAACGQPALRLWPGPLGEALARQRRPPHLSGRGVTQSLSDPDVRVKWGHSCFTSLYSDFSKVSLGHGEGLLSPSAPGRVAGALEGSLGLCTEAQAEALEDTRATHTARTGSLHSLAGRLGWAFLPFFLSLPFSAVLGQNPGLRHPGQRSAHAAASRVGLARQGEGLPSRAPGTGALLVWRPGAPSTSQRFGVLHSEGMCDLLVAGGEGEGTGPGGGTWWKGVRWPRARGPGPDASLQGVDGDLRLEGAEVTHPRPLSVAFSQLARAVLPWG